MKKIKTRIITLCLSLGLAVGTVFTPVSAYARGFDPETQLDGKLSTFHQGDAPDCGAVSAIEALDNSKYGRSLLRSMIAVNGNDTYTLNFRAGKQTITQEDVDNAPISGDLDARVIEAGLNQAIHVYNSCFAYSVFETITGFKDTTVYGAANRTNILNTMASRCSSGEGIMAACDFNIADESKGILGNGSHSYSVKSVTADTVVVVNPWDTSEDIYLSRSQFENSIRYMTYVNDTTKQVVIYWAQ